MVPPLLGTAEGVRLFGGSSRYSAPPLGSVGVSLPLAAERNRREHGDEEPALARPGAVGELGLAGRLRVRAGLHRPKPALVPATVDEVQHCRPPSLNTRRAPGWLWPPGGPPRPPPR